MATSVQELKKRIQLAMQDIMFEIAKDVTKATKDYIRKEWYIKRAPSMYYTRQGDNGGFIDTFLEGDELANSLDYVADRRGNRLYMRFLLRDYERLVRARPRRGEFGTHMSFDGEPTDDSFRKSEMDNLINYGWKIRYTQRGVNNGEVVKTQKVKRIKGIQFRQFAREYLNEHFDELLLKYGAPYGITAGRGKIGYKRQSIDLNDIIDTNFQIIIGD